MKSYEYTGKTIDEAIASGLSDLGLSREEVDIRVIEEGSKGLFGLFGSRLAKVEISVNDNSEMKAKIKALFEGSLEEAEKQEPKQAKKKELVKETAKENKKEAANQGESQKPQKQEKHAKQARKQAESEDAVKEARPFKAVSAPELNLSDSASKLERAEAFLKALSELMGVDAEIQLSSDEEGNVRASISGDSQGALIGKRGETLDSIQYLASLFMNKGSEQFTRLTVDCEGYRQKREEALIRLAKRMANRARKTGRRVSLEPMNPYERRILHSALQNEEGISTHSEGEEPNRRVVISLQKEYFLKRKEELKNEEEQADKSLDNQGE